MFHFFQRFMSSNFGFKARNLGAWVLSVHEMTSSTLRTAFRTTPKMPCPKYWRDSKHGRTFPGGIAFPQVLAVPENNHARPKYWRDSESINGTGESLSPKYWRFLDRL